MPVILGERHLAQWLDPANRDTDALRHLLEPAEEVLLEMEPVSTRVNSPRNDGPENLEPVAPQGPDTET